MLRTFAALALVAFVPSLTRADEPLQTVAEKSNYKATSKAADVIAFCEAIEKRSPNAKLDYFGTSHEGRKLPYLVIADPPVTAEAARRSPARVVVLAFANIHAGEVDGKEALLALARDLTDQKSHPLLKDIIVVLVPNLNADGNEKIDPKNRPEQNGPADGVGMRANAQGLDLNRDFVKLESPEIRALVKLVNEWNPKLIIDCHTTNGSKHRYTLTYDGPRYPSTDTEIAKWTANTFFPAVSKKVKDATKFDIAPYGNFDKERTKWETYPASPRYGVQYFALRGKVGVLSESYSYAPFKDRIDATKAFVTACLEVAVEKQREWRRFMRWDEYPPFVKTVAVRTKTDAFPDKLKVLGFEEVEKDGTRVATDKHKTYELDFVARVTPTEITELPYAYLVPADRDNAIRALQRHGIKVEELREDIDLNVDAFKITDFDPREFGVGMTKRVLINNLNGSWKSKEDEHIPAGTFVVKTGQPLGALAAYLLEPTSEDGLTTWSAFNSALIPGRDHPVLRVKKPVALALGAVRALPEDAGSNKPITEALLRGHGDGFAFGFAGSQIRTEWLDGTHFLQVKERQLLKVEARTGVGVPFADRQKVRQSMDALNKDINRADVPSLEGAASYEMNPDRTAFLFRLKFDLALGYFDGSPAVRLTDSPGYKDDTTFSPDGKKLSFVRTGNLFVVDIATRKEKQLTFDGGKDVSNATADWVYAEELFNRNDRAHWWAPDSKSILFLRFDDGPVKKLNLVDPEAPESEVRRASYPKPGEPNPHVKIGVVSADGSEKPKFLDMGDYDPENTLVVRVGWMGKSEKVFAYVQNRTQTWLDFVVWDSPDSKPKKLFRETTKAWVEDPGAPYFLADGAFLFLSPRDGWKHFYHYAADGKLLARITKGEWEVKDVLRVDGPGSKEPTIYFTANYTSATGTDLCRVKFGGDVEVLTEKRKSHRVSLAPTGGLFVDRFTDPLTPTRANLCEIGQRVRVIRTLDTNPVYEREQYKFGKYERVKIELKDGFVLEGAVTLPPDFDAKKKYPVWVFTYGGPNDPTVRDEWGAGHIMDQTLAALGIVCFRVDPRSASGKGTQSAWTCYKQLGVQELKDLEEAVTWLAKRDYIDASRVGISGDSYGGFLAAYALTHSKTFSAGIASCPVTDWKLYDSIYTERYMLTPEENPKGYEKSSCVLAAKNLHGKLLLVHGMLDDNVHIQNSTRFADALQREDKEFEMMFYPRDRHGVGGRHFQKLELSFIRRTMGVQK